MKQIDLEDDDDVVEYIKSLAPADVKVDRFRVGFIMILRDYVGRYTEPEK